MSGSQHTCAPFTVHYHCPWVSTGHQCQDPPQVPKSMGAQGPPCPRILHPQIHQPWIIIVVPNAVVYCLVTRSSLTLCGPMDCTCQASLSMGFSWQEYWSGLPFPTPGHLPNPGTERVSCWAGRCFITQLPGKCMVHGSFNPWMQNLQVQRANSTWAPFLMIFHPWFKSSSVHSGLSGMVGISGASLPTRSPDIRDRILSKLLCSHPCLWSHLQKCTSVGVTNTAAALACASAPPGCAMGTTTAGTGLMKPTVLVSISWPP